MHKARRITVTGFASLVLAAPALTACDRTGIPPTCDALSLSLAGTTKPKAPTTKTPRTVVKEPKRGGNGIIVVDADPVVFDDDDDCDDD